MLNAGEESMRQSCQDILAGAGMFSGRLPQRLVSGICTTSSRNKTGRTINPCGVRFRLPLPLILNHNFLRPVGEVRTIKETSAGLEFTARLCDGPLWWTDGLWEQLKSGAVNGVSVYAENRYSAVEFNDWELHEVSLVERALNPQAQILKVWQRHQVAYMDGRPSQNVYIDVRKGIVPTLRAHSDVYSDGR